MLPLRLPTLLPFALLVASAIPTSAQSECSGQAAVDSFGSGTAGSLGVPMLVSEGAPLLGLPHSFRLSGGAPDAAGVVFFSPNLTGIELPGYEATLYPGLPLFHQTFALDAEGVAEGLLPQASVSPSFCGSSCTTQAVILDDTAPGGVAFSAGLSISYGPTSAGIPLVDPVISPTGDSLIALTGQGIQPGNTIRIEGGANGVDEATLDEMGNFGVVVALQADHLNTLFVREIFPGDVSGPAATLAITQDSTPPSIVITFPPEGEVLSSSSTNIAGTVADTLSGFLGLSVSVNGLPAVVNVGIGSNGSFDLAGLDLPPNVPVLVTASASDSVGNTAVDQITIVHQPPAGGTVEVVRGADQIGTAGTELAEPIIVRTVKADGTPLPGKPVTLEVTLSDGRLASAPGSPGSLAITVVTDSAGEARAYWTLGSDAGMANNRVRATAATLEGAALFCASATPDAAKTRVSIGTGNGQVIQAGSQTPEPLRVWVNDGQNGLAGVAVDFELVSGGGALVSLEGGPRTSVLQATTGLTGHAAVYLIGGDEGGIDRVEVILPGGSDLPAVFTTRGIAPELSQTRFTGLVLDNSLQPIEGAGVELHFVDGQHIATDPTAADGTFIFEGLEASGKSHLVVFGSTATHVGGLSIVPTELAFPKIEYAAFVVKNGDNELADPVLLPRLDPENSVVYDGTEDVILTTSEIEGLILRVPAGTTVTKPDGTFVGPDNPITLSINQVHADDIPMPMPDGAVPPFAWTFQPSGALYNPPLPIEMPNMAALAPGAVVYFLAFDHDTGKFEIVGSGSVSSDGSTVASGLGQGLLKGGWGGFCPPYPEVGDVTDQCAGSDAPCCSEDSFVLDKIDVAKQAVATARLAVLGAKDDIVEASKEPSIWPKVAAGGGAVSAIITFLACSGLPPVCVAAYLASFGSGIAGVLAAQDSAPDYEALITSAQEKLDVAFERNLAALEALEAIEDTECTADTGLIGELATLNLISAMQGKISETQARLFLMEQDALVLSLQLVEEFITKSTEVNQVICSEYEIPPGCSTGNLPTTVQGSGGLSTELVDLLNSLLVVADSLSDLAVEGAVLEQGILDDLKELEVIGAEVDAVLNNESAVVNVGGVAVSLNGALGGFYLSSVPVSQGCPQRVRAVVSTPSGPLYGISPYFSVINQGTRIVSPLDLDTTPPITTTGLVISLGVPALTSVGQTTQVSVTAALSDGTVQPVSSFSEGVCYLSSSDEIVTISSTGLVTAVDEGQAFITVRKDGAAAVVKVEVTTNDPLTTVEGIIVDASFAPVIGADVTTSAGFATTSLDPGGSFQIVGHTTGNDPLRVDASTRLLGMPVFGFSLANPVAPGGTTQVGFIVVDVDTDGDQLPDWYETELYASNPLAIDSDGDGLADGLEVLVFGTNPSLIDSDGDGIADDVELELGSDPVSFDQVTTLAGMAEFPGGLPAAGAVATVLGISNTLFETVADGSGLFIFPNLWPASLSPVVVRAEADQPDGAYSGFSAPTPTVPNGTTLVGPIELEKGASGPIFPGVEYWLPFTQNVAAAIADWNGDGAQDVALAQGNLGTVGLLWNLGNGALDPELQTIDVAPPPGNTTHVYGSDVDADGSLDLVVVNNPFFSTENDSIEVLLGNGDGTFNLPASYPVLDPVGAVLEDLNGDGIVDFAAVEDTSPSQVSIFLGAGNGSFAFSQSFAAGSKARAMAAGDLDLDGAIDLVVADSVLNQAVLLFGDGDGTFAAPQGVGAGAFPTAIAVADLNSDGVPDITTANVNSADVSLLLGNGDGTFAFESLEVSGRPWMIEIADPSGDGNPDLIVPIDSIGVHEVAVFSGAGDGTFPTAQSVLAGNQPRVVAAGDLDGDGLPDVVVPRAGSLATFFGSGEQGAPLDSNVLAIDDFFGDVGNLGAQGVFDDFNGDGIVDFAAVSVGATVQVHLGAEAGTFQLPGTSIGLSSGPLDSIVSADFNDDGAEDLAVADTGADLVSVLLGFGDGSFLAPLNFFADRPADLTVADFTGDGLEDLAVLEKNAYPGSITIFVGNGDGSFSTLPGIPTDLSYSIAAADLNEDGNADLVSDSLSGTVVRFGQGGGAFSDPQTITPLVGAIELADLDGDGSVDLIISASSLAALLGFGDGTFGPLVETEVSLGSRIALGDLNGDGFLDIAGRGNSTSAAPVAVALGSGDGAFGPTQNFAVSSSGVQYPLISDLNLDGAPDLANVGGNGLVLLFNQLLD